VAVVAAAGAAALYYFRAVQPQPATGGGAALGVPTSTAVVTDLTRTIRLTGTTAARNFALITTPQMRGGRGTSLGEVRAEVTTAARMGGRGGGGGGGGGVSVGRVGGGPGGMGMGRGGQEGPGLTIVSMVAPGTMVKPGDPLVSFDVEEMRTRLEDFRTTVRQNQANMATLEASIEVARRSHNQGIKDARADLDTALLNVQTAPVRSAIDAENFRLQAEEAEATYQQVLKEVPLMEASLKAQYRAQQLALQESMAELKRMEANVEKMTLRAPIEGLVVIQTIQRRGATQAEQIKVGDQVGIGQPIMQIVDLSSMVLNATVNQVDAQMIRVGQKAEVRIDAFPGLALPAEVAAVGAITRQTGLRMEYVKEIPVTLRLLKSDPRVIPDLSGSADVVLESVPKALVVPREAVFQDGADQKPYVYVRGPDGWTVREVELGPRNFIWASIRSGLQPGDVVARQRPRAGTGGSK
jgi:membrane fusion protein (multidrug efflux system)